MARNDLRSRHVDIASRLAVLTWLRHGSLIRACAVLLSASVTAAAFGQSAAVAGSSSPAQAMPAESAPAPDESNLSTRPHLMGDWGGARSALAGNGVTFDLRYTSTYQGLASGNGDEDYQYGGKVDALINLDSAGMGLWKGGGLRSHLEYRHGPAPASLGGAIFAVNSALYWPVGAEDELVATSLYFTQQLGDRSSIGIGKFNPVDLLAKDRFFGGWGIDRFMNLMLVGPPTGLIPVAFMGAVASIRTRPVSWSIMVFDPEDRTNDYFPGDLFKTGVNVFVSGTHAYTFAGRKTTFAATGIYSTAEGVDYSSLGSGIGTSTKKGSYNVYVEFTHTLQQSQLQPDADWGFHLKVAIADGNPNYVQRSLIAGIAGSATFVGRPQDNFGLSAFYYNLSDVLQNSLAPFTEFRDEAGMEAYYSHAVTPWFHVSADLQYIKPATGSSGSALIPALRTQIRF
jgi:porin